MDLNKTYCASDCKNYECKDMLSYSILCAGEARGVPVKHKDLSDGCKDYKADGFLYRDHRGSLADSMSTVQQMDSIEDLETHLSKVYKQPSVGIITVEPYVYDKRVGWNTYIVCVDGRAVGFTDGPVKGL